MKSREKALRDALKECSTKNKNINACLRQRGFKLQKVKPIKLKYPKVKIKEFDNIQNALKKLRRLRGL